MFRGFWLFFFFIACSSVAYSQCTKSIGTPLVNETFGSGVSAIGPALPAGVTNLNYVNTSCPNDGQYTIANYTSGCFSNTWHTLTDHTGDPNGYFMLVNASYDPSDFFVKTVNGLCTGTTYNFSAWVVNMVYGGGIAPNVTFTIEQTDGTVLGTYNSGDIPATNPVTWQKYGFYFTTPVGISTVVVRMHNNAPGGGGNDLALDDISFAPAGPETIIGVNGTASNTFENTCSQSISLFSKVGTCYVKNDYQWEQSADSKTWTDIAGANNSEYVPTLSASGTYYYRLSVAENGNIASVSCRTNSDTLTLIYHKYTPPTLSNIAVSICQGANYTLPSGKVVDATGLYNDTVRTTQGCDSILTTLNLTVKPKASSTITAAVCEGQTYLGYDKTGTYVDVLTAYNGCDSLRTLNLIVNKKTSSNLTNTICEGETFLGYNKTGVYIDVLTGSNGCDSVRTLNLTVKAKSYSSYTNTICEGNNYFGHTKAGVYVDTLLAANGCDSIRTLNLTVKPKSYSTISTSVCWGDSFMGYTKSGTYVDTLVSSVGCDSIRTVNLTVNDQLKPDLGGDRNLCIGDTLLLNPGIFAHYLWQDGSTSPTHAVVTDGTYSVKVTDQNGCDATASVKIKQVYCSLIQIPNTFTPNGDGVNDVWNIYALQYYPTANVSIFNRWGQRVFNSIGYPKPWDGRYNGKNLPTGTYYYVIDLKDGRKPISGYVVIAR